MNRPFGPPTGRSYYVLVAVTLLTVALGAYINNQLAASGRRSLAANELLASQLARLAEVERVAAAVNGPGNDVFSSRDPVAERQRMQTAAARFREQIRVARHEASGDRFLLRELGKAEEQMLLMVRESEEIFRLVALHRTDEAAVSMALMDRNYARLRTDLTEARDEVRDRQMAEFHHESVRSSQWSRRQGLRVVLMAFLVLMLVAYGRRVHREVSTSREREQDVKSLHENAEALREAVSERDVRTAELSHNQALLSEAQRLANLGAWEWGIGSGRLWWSDQLFRMFGAEPGAFEPSFEAYLERVAPRDREQVAQRIARAVQDHVGFENEYEIILPNGEVRVHRCAARVDVDRSGTPVRVFGVARDISEQKWAEEQLLRQEAQLAEAQRIARVGSWELHVKAGSVNWSDELHAMLGYESGEVAPSFRAYMSLIRGGERTRVYNLLASAMAGGDRFEFEHSLVRRDGLEVWLFVQGVIDRDATGKPVRILGVSQDITERKKAEEDLRLSEERFQLSSQATNDVIWDLDLTSNRIWVNESFASRMGYPEWGDIDLTLWLNALHSEDSERFGTTMYEALASDASVFTCNYRFRAFDGNWRDVLNRGHIVRDENGKAVRVIGAMMDISERRAVDRMKDEFISTVSHELRTPLTSIRGALGLLSSGLMGALPEKGMRLLEIASSNTDRLVRLINDILDIERIESGKVTLNRTMCEAGVLARAAAEVVGPLAERENISLEIDAVGEVPMMADSDRIIQTLTNLLGNAVKFSPPGSRIQLAIRAEDESVLFSVADRGRGIPADRLETIFERFQQVDASDSRDKGGSGLGLTICRSIVRQHGGEIRVESTPGLGSTFTVTVPSGVAAVASAACQSIPPPGSVENARLPGDVVHSPRRAAVAATESTRTDVAA